jgi:hypothetical protein
MRVQRRADRRASVGRRTGQMTTHGRVTSDTRHPGDCAFSTCQPVRAGFIGGSIELTGARLSLQLHRRADLKAGQITLFSRRVGTPDAHAVKVGDGPRAGSAVRRSTATLRHPGRDGKSYTYGNRRRRNRRGSKSSSGLRRSHVDPLNSTTWASYRKHPSDAD